MNILICAFEAGHALHGYGYPSHVCGEYFSDFQILTQGFFFLSTTDYNQMKITSGINYLIFSMWNVKIFLKTLRPPHPQINCCYLQFRKKWAFVGTFEWDTVDVSMNGHLFISLDAVAVKTSPLRYVASNKRHHHWQSLPSAARKTVSVSLWKWY